MQQQENDQDIVTLAKDLDVPEQVQNSGPTISSMPQIPTNLPEATSNLQQRTLAALISQKKQHAVYVLSVDIARNTHIQTIDYSYNYLMNHIRTNSSVLSFYKGIRADLKITVEVSSMMQHQGAIIAYQTNAPSTMFNSIINEVISNTRYPRKFITLGHDGTYTFTIPWNSNLEFFPISSLYPEKAATNSSGSHNQYMSNGRIIFRVFDPMQAVTNATTPCTIRFWVELVNTKLFVYNPDNANNG